MVPRVNGKSLQLLLLCEIIFQFVNDTQVQLTVNGSTGFELSLIFSGFQDSFTVRIGGSDIVLLSLL